MASVRKALVLTVASNATGIILQLLVVVILSRLLTPTEVGVYSVAAVLSGLAGVVRDFGVGEYLIQEKDLTRDKIRAAITANLVVSWSMTAILLLVARPVAAFYGEPGVGEVMTVLAASFLVTPFGAVAMAFLRREMQFWPMYWATLVSGTGSGVIAIVLAYRGFGYMSLAWSSLASSILIVIVSLAMRPAHLPFLPGLKDIGEVIRFGTHMSGIYVSAHVGRGAPDLVIGRMIDMEGVGLFSRAGGVLELIHRFILRGIRPVMLPYFSAQRRAGRELEAGFLKGVTLITGVTWPAVAFLGLMAFPATRLLYGEQWIASVPLMQVLCIVFAIEVVFLTATEVMIAAGHISQSSRLQLTVQAIRIAAIVVGSFFGLLAISIALLFSALINATITARALRRAIDLEWSPMWEACRPSLGAAFMAALPAAAFVAVAGAHEGNYLFALVVSGAGGGAGWLFSIFWLRHPLHDELIRMWGRLSARGGQ